MKEYVAVNSDQEWGIWSVLNSQNNVIAMFKASEFFDAETAAKDYAERLNRKTLAKNIDKYNQKIY